MRDEARIRTVSQHGGGCTGIAGTQREYFFAHGVVGAASRRDCGIGISTRPRLDTRVQVHRSFFPTELDQGDARDFDGDVHEEVTASQQWVQHATEILACQRFLDDFHAKFLGLLETALMRRHDRDAIRSDANVAQQQWQDALPDAAEAYEQNAPGKFDVNFAHDSLHGLRPGSHGVEATPYTSRARSAPGSDQPLQCGG